MKTTAFVSLAALAAALIAAQCGEFPNRFDRIEPDALRFISFSFLDHAEGAPGDTVRVRAYFAGEKTVKVRWRISYDCFLTQYGTETILAIHDLPLTGVTDRLPDSIDIAFVIPDSVFVRTQAISKQMLDAARAQLPASMSAMSQQDLAAVLHDLAGIDFENPVSAAHFIDTWGQVTGVTGPDSASMERLFSIGGVLVYAFSMNAKLFADAVSDQGHSLSIRGDFTVRYNSRFKNTPFAAMAPVNRNPAVRWVGVYKVKGFKGMTFSPQDPANAGTYSFSYLYNERFPWKANDTVLIEKGYDYFLAADSGIVRDTVRAGDSMAINGATVVFQHDTVIVDSVLDGRIWIDSATGKPKIDYETYFYNWQYQPSLDSVTQPLDSLFVIQGASPNGGGMQSPIVRFLPSMDKKMKKIHLWVSVYDWLFGELFRPQGFTVRNFDVHFRYAE